MNQEVKGRKCLYVHDDGQVPSFRVDFYLVPYGYEADFYVDGKCIGASLRDFGDDHDIHDVINWLYAEMKTVLARLPIKFP